MTYKGSLVRRLSTASCASKPPHFILTTEWLWYWKENTGKWVEFGQVSVLHSEGAIKPNANGMGRCYISYSWKVKVLYQQQGNTRLKDDSF